jgi:hypothetical protein
MEGLYDSDVLLWSEQQALTLQRLAKGERVNDTVDWVHVIDEVLDVGRAELHACESLLQQALMHMVKLGCDPSGLAAAHWRVETIAFLRGAARRYTPSMRQRIDVEALFQDALRDLERSETIGANELARFGSCPHTLETLLLPDAGVADLVAPFLAT